jgi:hypothetical protein
VTTSLRKYALIAVLAVSGPLAAHGQSIFSNPITGPNPSASDPYTTGQTVDPHLTVSGIGRSSALDAISSSNQYSGANWDPSGDSLAYFTFTLTPASGYQLNLTSFVFSSTRSFDGPTSLYLRSSLDSFTDNIATVSSGTTINLTTGATYQNLTESIEFRLYGDSGTSSGGILRISDFTFNGSVVAAIPEPSSCAAIFGAATLAGATWYRRRSTKSSVTAA